MFNFEKLDVWQKAITLADVIYNDTRSFPADERFVEIATGSVFELVSQGFVARRQSFLTEEGFRAIYVNAEEIGRMLSGLRNSLMEG
jgi:hypothetical protein